MSASVSEYTIFTGAASPRDEGPSQPIETRRPPRWTTLEAAVSLTLAMTLIGVCVWLSVSAVFASVPADAWVYRLAGVAATGVAHLLLWWGVSNRVFPISPLDKGTALTSSTIAVLAGIGAAVLAIAV